MTSDSLAPAALAAALLYGMYSINSHADTKQIRPPGGTPEEDDEMVAQMKASGIQTHILINGMGYMGSKNGAGGNDTISPQGVGLGGIWRYAKDTSYAMHQAYAKELFNEISSGFTVPNPYMKPTFVHIGGYPLPGISPNYRYTTVHDPVPKIGRAESRW